MSSTIEGTTCDGGSILDVEEFDEFYDVSYDDEGYYDWRDNWHERAIETDFDVSDDNWACGTLEVD